MQSSHQTGIYNCISWSVGVTSAWIWPLWKSSKYYAENDLEAFDNLYNDHGLTRDGATAENAVVALWAKIDENGNRHYTHASVTDGNGYLHGFAWESKLGSNERIFHPRDILYDYSDSGYGEIVEYYTLDTNRKVQSVSSEIYDTEIGDANFTYNSAEVLKLQQIIAQIPSEIQLHFSELFTAWKSHVSTTYLSNPTDIANCTVYKQLITFYKDNQSALYLLLQQLSNHDLASMILMENLIESPSSFSLIAEAANVLHSPSQYKTTYAAHMAVAKIILANTETQQSSSVNQSAIADFQIDYSNTTTAVFKLSKAQTVTLRLTTLDGTCIDTLINGRTLQSGEYRLPISATSGLYILKLTTPTAENSLKIIIP